MCGEYSVNKLRQHSIRPFDVPWMHDSSVPQVSLDSDSDTAPNAVPSDSLQPDSYSGSHTVTQKKWTSASRNTDSDIQSDDMSPSTNAKQKMVAIDISQNKHFTRRLLPVVSPEFDNVIDQVH